MLVLNDTSVEQATAQCWRVTAERVLLFAGARHRFIQAELHDSDLEVGLLGLPDSIHNAALRISLFGADDALLHQAATAIVMAFDLPRAAVECVAQRCSDGQALIALFWLVEGSQVSRERAGGCYIVRQPGIDWGVSSCERMDHEAGELNHKTADAFTTLGQQLGAAGFGFPDWLRTWIYIGGIDGGPHPFANYQAINRGREQAFRQWQEAHGGAFRCPASTGIGTLANLAMSVLAARASEAICIRPVENARQTSAYNYPEAESAVVPLFSRGMAVQADDATLVLVSGTASIIEAKSVHRGDAMAQTQQTLANIDAVLAASIGGAAHSSNLARLGSIQFCVVYVKSEHDLTAVKQVCQACLPPAIPLIYTLAHVCRPELLVEIECLALLPAERASVS